MQEAEKALTGEESDTRIFLITGEKKREKKGKRREVL